MPGAGANTKDRRLNDQSLAYYGNRVVRPPPEPRRAAAKRALSWTLVVLVHLLFLAMLTFQFVEEERLGRKGAIETILDLSMFHNDNAPRITLIKPEVESPGPPQVTTAPILITPPKPIPEQESAPPAPGDVLKAIGEALACGASNFENLTDRQRARCLHEPWQPRKLPNGTIVLEAPPKQAQPEIHLSGAEAMRHDMEVAPPCPILQQAPCIDDIIKGRSRAPF
jgi:hypothetical protein